MQLDSVTLTGSHVRLEPLVAAHLPALLQHGADAEIWRYLPCRQREAVKSVQAWFEQVTVSMATGHSLGFAIMDVARNEAVGGTTYMDISVKDRRLEIGNTWLGRAVWRTAINTEAKFLLLRHAFETLGCHRVQLKTDGRNLRSQAAIERLGAVKEGVLRSHMVLPDGHGRDTVMFSVIAAEWSAVKARLVTMLTPS
jgi:RimJ/RimL family protein N-acetyltransferase